MHRSVLLHHQLPDGTSHYDWMIERGTGLLLTLRVDARIDDPSTMTCQGERLTDHRAAYLDYEGPVSGNRGHVTRLAEGRGAILIDAPDCLEIEVEFRHAPALWRGRPADGLWRFSRSTTP